MAQATAVSPQVLLKAAKALVDTYNAKDWDGARAAITNDFVYEEMGTGRKLTGAEATLEAYRGWAQAFPDSVGTYRATHVADDGTVVLELTWSGTHRGPLQTPDGPIAPTGKRIEIPACIVVEVAGEGQGAAALLRHGDALAPAGSPQVTPRAGARLATSI